MKHILILTLLTAPSMAHAESYLDKKDTEALGIIRRALERAPEDPALFDGQRIPQGTDVRRVGQYLDRLGRAVDNATRYAGGLSARGRARAEAKPLLQALDARAQYRARLDQAYQTASAQANQRAQTDRATKQATRKERMETCKAFRAEIDPRDRNNLDTLAALARRNDHLRVDTGPLQETAARVGPVCGRAEYRDIGPACGAFLMRETSKEGGWCAAVLQADRLLGAADQRAVARATDAERAAGSPEELKRREGWVRFEGPVKWSKLDKTPTLKASVTKLASTWKVPGAPCRGGHCKNVKYTIGKWYGASAKIGKVTQKHASWKVVQNKLGITTHRFRSGHVLLKVRGEPYCQLRSWTVRQTHQARGGTPRRREPKSDTSAGRRANELAELRMADLRRYAVATLMYASSS